MQWSVFLLSLMGQCFFFTCHIHVYHFIGETKTWDEAQKYCRENYTDLATVSNMTDMKRLLESTQSQDEAWIGLHSSPGKNNRMWYWSLPGVQFTESETRWHPREPNDSGGLENCVEMSQRTWNDMSCTSTQTFICYDETNQSNKTCHVINYKMTWPQAQNYCRVNHTDLISGLHQLDDCAETGPKMWIGLFRDTWRWSDGSNSSFRYWESLSTNDLVDGQSNKTCATTVLNKTGEWSFDDCSNKKPFICYSDKVILIKEKMAWNDSLNYCRKNYRNLVSITNSQIQTWVQETAKNADTSYVWMGLRYTCTLDLWFWVNDELLCYKNWDSDDKTTSCGHAAAMGNEGQYKWFKKESTEKFNFICSKF